MESGLDILAFAAHPDDAEIGCGGSLALAVEAGRRVAVADLTMAEGSTRGNPVLRQKEVQAASEQLGLAERYNLGLPDTKLGSDLDQRDPVIQLIRETRPKVVLAPYWVDRHPDHEAAGRLIKQAFFYAGVSSVGKGEAYRPERLYYYLLHHPFEPSFVINISSTWRRKMAAIGAFASQFTPATDGEKTGISRPDFLRFIEARAIYFGALIGAGYGEAFFAQGPISLQTFPELAGRASDSHDRNYSVFSP